MIISCLVENTSLKGLETEHGLSIHIQTEDGRSLLFDTGQSGKLLIQNALAMGIDLSEVDLLVISHGHYDHGGGIQSFLEANQKAPVFIRKDAFEPHYSIHEDGPHDIGLTRSLKDHPRIRLVERDVLDLEGGLKLFTTPRGGHDAPPGSIRMRKGDDLMTDDFSHEMCLGIKEGKKCVLFSGCAHRGILNIMDRAERLLGTSPTHVIGGMHLKDGDPDGPFIKDLSEGLLRFPNTRYLTCHCTGEEVFCRLKALMKDKIRYLSTGMSVNLT